MLKEKYQQLSYREKHVLKLATPFALLLLIWIVIIQPIIKTDSRLTKNIATKEQQLSWMKDNASNVEVKSSKTRAAANNQNELRQLMNQLLKIHSISADRIQNINSSTVSYRLNENKFNNILKLINDLQDMGVTISQLQITKSQKSGNVSTRLAVAVGA